MAPLECWQRAAHTARRVTSWRVGRLAAPASRGRRGRRCRGTLALLARRRGPLGWRTGGSLSSEVRQIGSKVAREVARTLVKTAASAVDSAQCGRRGRAHARRETSPPVMPAMVCCPGWSGTGSTGSIRRTGCSARARSPARPDWRLLRQVAGGAVGLGGRRCRSCVSAARWLAVGRSRRAQLAGSAPRRLEAKAACSRSLARTSGASFATDVVDSTWAVKGDASATS